MGNICEVGTELPVPQFGPFVLNTQAYLATMTFGHPIRFNTVMPVQTHPVPVRPLAVCIVFPLRRHSLVSIIRVPTEIR
jgi:hypothetical protein